MKPQDVIFFTVLVCSFMFKRGPRWFAGAGIFCLLLAIPLFARWVFFTAERLTWYAAAFFLASVLLYLLKYRNVK